MILIDMVNLSNNDSLTQIHNLQSTCFILIVHCDAQFICVEYKSLKILYSDVYFTLKLMTLNKCGNFYIFSKL